MSIEEKAPPARGASNTEQAESHDCLSAPAHRRVVSRWGKPLCLGLAAIFFVIAGLGAVLPGLPVTPFLLLTSYFLVRSSPRLNAALLRSRVFGPILTDWQLRGGVRRHVKYKSITAVVAAVTLTIYLTGVSPALTLTVASLAAVGIIVILRLPDAKDP